MNGIKAMAAMVVLLWGFIATATIDGDWKGRIDAGAQRLGVVFHVKGAKCSLDVPVQGAFGVSGKIAHAKNGTVEFTFKAIGGCFTGKMEGGRLVGVWRQGAGEYPLTLVAGAMKMARPQEPKPPFPYLMENVVFKNADALDKSLKLPPEAVITNLLISLFFLPCKHFAKATCSLSIGYNLAFVFFNKSLIISPPTTKDSLLASAKSIFFSKV